MSEGNLLAISDLHVGHADNRRFGEDLRPTTDGDWPRRSHMTGSDELVMRPVPRWGAGR
ncbi:hypothetical protein [Streptomyces yangpuensis]